MDDGCSWLERIEYGPFHDTELAESAPSAAPVSACHSASHFRKRPLDPAALGCHAAKTGPSSANMSTASIPFDRRSVARAWVAVCAIGPATLNEVFTATSTPILRPSALR